MSKEEKENKTCDYWYKDSQGIVLSKSHACGRCNDCLEYQDINNERWLY